MKRPFNEMLGYRDCETLQENKLTESSVKPGLDHVSKKIMFWSSYSPVEIGFVVPKARPRNRALEEAFEEARLKYSPDAPSRLDCVFVCPNNGRGFCNGRTGGEYVYKVLVTGKIFATDGGLWTEAHFRPEYVDGWAKQYWKPEGNLNINLAEEVLVDGSVVVVAEAKQK